MSDSSAKTGALGADSPLLRRFWAYLAERFPLGPYTVLVLALTAAVVASAAAGRGVVAVSLREGAAFLVLLLFFFHLRVFDEWKDAEDDRLAHPERVLSRGLVTLRHLAWAGGICAGLQAALAVWLGSPAVLWWGGAFLFSLLMRVEFFAPDFLRRHVLVYAVTHNPVVLLLVLFVDHVHRAGAGFDARALLFGAVATFTTLGFEVGRKIRAPEDEREGQATYTDALGVKPAAALMVALATLAAASTVFVGIVLGTSAVFLVLGPLACLLPALPAFAFARRPTPALAKAVDGAASGGALVVYVALALDVFLRQGVVGSWT